MPEYPSSQEELPGFLQRQGRAFLLALGFLTRLGPAMPATNHEMALACAYYPVAGAVLGAARYIVSCDMRRLLKFTLTDEALSSLSAFAERYLLTCMERSFKTLAFYRSLL